MTLVPGKDFPQSLILITPSCCLQAPPIPPLADLRSSPPPLWPLDSLLIIYPSADPLGDSGIHGSVGDGI